MEPTTEPVVVVEQDPELLAQLEELIIGDVSADLSLQYTDDLWGDCESSGVSCYSPEKVTIFMVPGMTDFRQPLLLAHEYLHHIWWRDGLGEDPELVAALDEAFENPEGLRATMPPRHTFFVNEEGWIHSTELFSYSCTGLRLPQMPPVVAKLCEQYLNLDALPVNQQVEVEALSAAITALRESHGLAPFADNPHATAGAEAHLDLITPYSLEALDGIPDSVRQLYSAGCPSPSFTVLVTHPYDPALLVEGFNASLEGDFTSAATSGIGIAVKEFDYLDSDSYFGEGTVCVNSTLIMVTTCR